MLIWASFSSPFLVQALRRRRRRHSRRTARRPRSRIGGRSRRAATRSCRRRRRCRRPTADRWGDSRGGRARAPPGACTLRAWAPLVPHRPPAARARPPRRRRAPCRSKRWVSDQDSWSGLLFWPLEIRVWRGCKDG